MDNSFKNLISQATSVLVLLPVNPNFDQVAAGCALYLSLRERANTSCEIACVSPMIVEFNRIVGVDKVTADLGSKNLVISFRDYKAENLERVSYDIENGEVKLTVIPKGGFTAPHSDQVIMSHSGVSVSTVVLVDGVSEKDFPMITSPDFAQAKLIHVGLSAPAFTTRTDIASYGTTMSSVSEIMAILMKESALQVNPDIATNLLWGIETGSKNYSGIGVTADTFQITAELLRLGAKRQGVESVQAVAPVQAAPVQAEPVQNPPTDWLNNPKIFTGTNVS